MKKIKILLAVGDSKVEEFIAAQLPDEVEVVAAVAYREAILAKLNQSFSKKSNGILVLREALTGTENIVTLCEKIRVAFPNIRIIFMGGGHQPGDSLLMALINLGVYDLIVGEQINIFDVLRCVTEPMTYSDIAYMRGNGFHAEIAEELIEDTPIYVNKVVPKKKFFARQEEEPMMQAYVTSDGHLQAINENKEEKERINNATSQEEQPQHIEAPVDVRTGIEDASKTENTVEVSLSSGIHVEDGKTKTEDEVEEVELTQQSQSIIEEDINDFVEPVIPVEEEKDKIEVFEPVMEDMEKVSLNQEQEKSETKVHVNRADTIQNRVQQSPQKQNSERVTYESRSVFSRFNNRKSSVNLPVHKELNVVNFICSSFGSGTRDIAFNVALALASDSKVLYMDFTDDFPVLCCRMDYTMDMCIQDWIEDGNAGNITNYVTNLHKLSNYAPSEPERRRFQRIPGGLDVICVNHERPYQVQVELLDELVTQVRAEYMYDYVVFVCAGVKDEGYVKYSCSLSNYNFLVANQYSTNIRNAMVLNEMMKRNGYTYSMILNKYEKIRPSDVDIASAFKIEEVFCIPGDYKGFLSADAKCSPYIYETKNKKVLNEFISLKKKIIDNM